MLHSALIVDVLCCHDALANLLLRAAFMHYTDTLGSRGVNMMLECTATASYSPRDALMYHDNKLNDALKH